MMLRLFTFGALTAAGLLPAADSFPPVKSLGDTSSRGAAIQRTMTLLDSSAVEKKNTVRILFYGQSITEQIWWEIVKEDLASRFPAAVQEVENLAIGGHSAQLLHKTAEADLYPFYPDLVVFHVYGDHNRYADIIRRIRERTTAEVIMQTDHLAAADKLDEPVDAAGLTPAQWNPWMNYAFLPDTARKYGCELLPVRDIWKQYLRDHSLSPRQLLKDDVHLNEHGNYLMSEIVKSAFVVKDAPQDAAWRSLVKEVPVTEASWKNGGLSLTFEGNRVDGVFGTGAPGGNVSGITMKIDGKAPEEIRQLYTFTRASGYSGTNWPCLLRVQRGPAQLQEEDWTLSIGRASDDYTNFTFAVIGSKTGPDGIGSSTKKFVSKSGRLVIDPEDWNLANCRKVFGRKLDDGFRIRWKSQPMWNAAPLARGPVLGRGTFVQGLSNGKHTLELSGEGLRAMGLTAFRVYRPPFPQTEDPAADASGAP